MTDETARTGEGRMHAALVTITIDPSQAPAAAVSIDGMEIRRVAVAVP
jgi:hypothetical protein